MKIKIEKSVAVGSVKAPPSKSYAHRLLICSALADGKSTVYGISESDDMRATLGCINSFGINYTKEHDIVSIQGINLHMASSATDFYCNESGSTLRFFIPIALAIGGKFNFHGTERLISRGISVYEDICKNQGITCIKFSDRISFDGKLKPDTFNVPGDISSQFISGLLFALPLLDGDSVINITTELESAKYIDITIDTLNSFGIKIERENNSFYIKGNQKYISRSVTVEGDASNGAFLDAFNILGGEVSVKGIKEDTLQADGIYKELFLQLANGEPTIDISSCPDLGPILFALASVKNGATFIGTRRLRIKESDRASAMASELAKLGINVTVEENSVRVYGGKITSPKNTLYGHNDHRIVMALAVILTLVGGEIDGCEAVSKSYPDFFEVIKTLNVRLEEIK